MVIRRKKSLLFRLGVTCLFLVCVYELHIVQIIIEFLKHVIYYSATKHSVDLKHVLSLEMEMDELEQRSTTEFWLRRNFNVTAQEKEIEIQSSWSGFKKERLCPHANCKAIVNGDIAASVRAKLSSWKRRLTALSAFQYTNLTNNCTHFLTKRFYVLSPLTYFEKQFPIAFSILIYKEIEQAERLLRAIYRPQNVYCLHVDQKASKLFYSAVLGITKCFNNVFVLQTRVNVMWGRISVLEPEVLCMKHLWRHHNKRWNYYINLTGQEFPLRTNYEIVQMLKALNGSNAVHVDTSHHWGERWHTVDRKLLPSNTTLVKGSLHAVLSRGFVDFVLHDKRAISLYHAIEHTIVPDETFYPTLNYNLHLGVPGGSKQGHSQGSIARYKLWRNATITCRGKYVRDICIFGTADLPKLTKAKEMFVNKLYLGYEYSLECLEEWHFNRTRDQYMLLNETNTKAMVL